MKKRNRSGRFVKTGSMKKCKVCDSEFWLKPCLKDIKKYCSNDCRYKGLKGRIIKREVVEKIAEKNRGQVRSEEWKENRSEKSFGENNPNWKGGKSKAGRRRTHRKMAKECIEENPRCEKCGDNKMLEIDHIIPWSVNKSMRFKKENIQVLCRPCHQEKTSKDGRKYWKNQFGKSEYWKQNEYV